MTEPGLQSIHVIASFWNFMLLYVYRFPLSPSFPYPGFSQAPKFDQSLNDQLGMLVSSILW